VSAGPPGRPPPRRVAVTGPRRARAGGWSARAAAEDLRAQPRLAQVYVRSLVRDQFRLALGVLAVLAVVLGGLPAAFAVFPALRTARVLGFPLAWLLLGVVAYPLLIGFALFHLRHAERVERDFTDLLGPSPDTARPAPPGPSPDLPPGGGLVARFPAPLDACPPSQGHPPPGEAPETAPPRQKTRILGPAGRPPAEGPGTVLPGQEPRDFGHAGNCATGPPLAEDPSTGPAGQEPRDFGGAGNCASNPPPGEGPGTGREGQDGRSPGAGCPGTGVGCPDPGAG